jgi:hypothetical protein
MPGFNKFEYLLRQILSGMKKLWHSYYLFLFLCLFLINSTVWSANDSTILNTPQWTFAFNPISNQSNSFNNSFATLVETTLSTNGGFRLKDVELSDSLYDWAVANNIFYIVTPQLVVKSFRKMSKRSGSYQGADTAIAVAAFNTNIIELRFSYLITDIISGTTQKSATVVIATAKSTWLAALRLANAELSEKLKEAMVSLANANEEKTGWATRP